MMHCSKLADERREAGGPECWLLHGAAGMAADWRGLAKRLADAGAGSRAVDLWRFCECQPMSLEKFGPALNAEAAAARRHAGGPVLIGYSMGGRLALHALMEQGHPWSAAVIISAHPGLECPDEREARLAADARWAAMALTGNWMEFLTAWNAQPLLGTAMPRPPGEDSRLMTRRREIARSFIDWSLGAQQPLWERLCEITIPVLWVAGENDPNFQALAERAAARIPACETAIAPAAGHRVPWEAEEWLASAVRRFLNC